MSCYSTYLSPIHWYRFKGPAEVSASKSGKMSPIFIAKELLNLQQLMLTSPVRKRQNIFMGNCFRSSD